MGEQTDVIISVRCGAAARGGVNEDNCLVLSSVGNPSAPIDHQGNGDWITKASLGRNGCLLVVADGMGGMNAGEVASQIAVETIASVFRSDKFSTTPLTDENIRKILNLAILKADKVIKDTGARNPAQKGMGTTVAMLWLVQGKGYYAWCGDSRVYRYNDGTLAQLTSDHSYVCEVLRLSEEEAFNHPNSNIITRSLGNPAEQAKPEIGGPIVLREGDVFLLCSDGLCGVLRKADILNDLQSASCEPEKLNEGNLLLWEDAERHGWHDNVTSLLCYVSAAPNGEDNSLSAVSKTLDPKKTSFGDVFKNKRRVVIVAILLALLILLGVVLSLTHKKQPKTDTPATAPTPTEQVTSAPAQEKPEQVTGKGHDNADEITPVDITEKRVDNGTPANSAPPSLSNINGNGNNTSAKGGNKTSAKETSPAKSQNPSANQPGTAPKKPASSITGAAAAKKSTDGK